MKSYLDTALANVHARERGRCFWCRRTTLTRYRKKPYQGIPRTAATFDHVLARRQGVRRFTCEGVLSCSECNLERGMTDARAWLAFCKRRGTVPPDACFPEEVELFLQRHEQRHSEHIRFDDAMTSAKALEASRHRRLTAGLGEQEQIQDQVQDPAPEYAQEHVQEECHHG